MADPKAPAAGETESAGPGGAAAPDPLDRLVGQSILDGQYVLGPRIGRGAMGAVYRATQPSIGRTVAVKVLVPEAQTEEAMIARFNREARAASRLTHPNSVHVHLFGRLDDGTLFTVMEYLEGEDLGSLLVREAPLVLRRGLRIMLQTLGALSEAHAMGIIHRDLKPPNIFLTTQGGIPEFVKVLDYGIAKILVPDDPEEVKSLTQAGTVFGTPEYMSPEQARGERVDARADLYAVAVILYVTLAARHPFRATLPIDYLAKHAAAAPIPLRQQAPHVPEEIGQVIMGGLAKRPADRPQTAAEFASELIRAWRAAADRDASVPHPELHGVNLPPASTDDACEAEGGPSHEAHAHGDAAPGGRAAPRTSSSSSLAAVAGSSPSPARTSSSASLAVAAAGSSSPRTASSASLAAQAGSSPRTSSSSSLAAAMAAASATSASSATASSSPSSSMSSAGAGAGSAAGPGVAGGAQTGEYDAHDGAHEHGEPSGVVPLGGDDAGEGTSLRLRRTRRSRAAIAAAVGLIVCGAAVGFYFAGGGKASIGDGRLVVDTTPPGATASLDGAAESPTPARFASVSAGEHTLEIKKSGHKPVTDHVTVGDGEEVVRRYVLDPAVVSVYVTTAVTGALVLAEQSGRMERVGPAPAFYGAVPLGTSVPVEVYAPGYAAFIGTIEVPRNLEHGTKWNAEVKMERAGTTPDLKAVLAEVDHHPAQFRACIPKTRTIESTELSLTIDGGTVTHARVLASDMAGGELGHCLENAARKLTWPKIPAGARGDYIVPLVVRK